MPFPSFPRFHIPPSLGRFLRSPWFVRGVLIVAVIAVGGYFFRDAVFGTPVAVQEVTRGELVETVVASGRVMTPQRVSIGAVTTERVARIPVGEGQSVRRDDVLFVLDDRDEVAAVAQAQTAVDQAEARLRQLREVALPAANEALLQAQANRELAGRQYDRSVQLLQQKFISQAALDDARRNLDVAESQLKAARLQVQTNSSNGGDYRMAQAARAQAQAAADVASVRLEQTIVRAPADGVLIARNVEPGDVVQPGKELMVLAPVGETQIVVQIDEKNLSQLKLGQKALASADAYPRERFAAELFYINPGIDAQRGSVEVKLRVRDPPAYVRQDMTVSVDIEVARRHDTVMAPADAIFDMGGAHPWVLSAENGHALKKPVTIGFKGAGQVEVLAGVAPGDWLIPAAAGVVPGQRVRTAVQASGTSP